MGKVRKRANTDQQRAVAQDHEKEVNARRATKRYRRRGKREAAELRQLLVGERVGALQLEVDTFIGRQRNELETVMKPVHQCLAALKKALLALKNGKVNLQVGKAKEKWEFETPDELRVIGSMLSQSSPLLQPISENYSGSSRLNIDIGVRMPTRLFKKRDALQGRYLDKRAAYVLEIVRQIKSNPELSSLITWIKVVPFRGNFRKPIIALQWKTTPDVVYRLFPYIDAHNFKSQRFLPHRNLLQDSADENELSSSSQSLKNGSAMYNQYILEDMYLCVPVERLAYACERVPALSDALLLLKIWFWRRNLNGYMDGPNGFVLSMVAVHLFHTKRLSRSMNALQVFKGILAGLVQLFPSKNCKPLLLGAHERGSNHPALIQEHENDLQSFAHHFELSLIDEDCGINFFSYVSLDAWQEVVAAAEGSLPLLGDGLSVDVFGNLFLETTPSCLQYDLAGRFVLPASDEELDACSGFHGLIWARKSQQIRKVLQQGWGKRCPRFRLYVARPQPQRQETDACTASPFLLADKGALARYQKQDQAEKFAYPAWKQCVYWLAIRVDPVHAHRVVDRGPTAEDVENVAKFRSFWGSKAALRRFQDGAIVQAVVWDGNQLEKNYIPLRIAAHLLQHHFGLGVGAMKWLGHQFDEVLLPADDYGAHVCAAWQPLSRVLSSLKDLPLPVRSFQLVSAGFRSTSTLAPVPSSQARSGVPDEPEIVNRSSESISARNSPLIPLQVLVHLSQSGRWPDELMAIQRIRTAFYCNMVEELTQRCKVRAVAREKYVDVYFGGYVFRLTIHYRREIALMHQEEGKEEIANRLLREQVEAPAQATLMTAIKHANWAFAPTVRLLHRWLCTHYCTPHVDVEFAEMIVASVFVSRQPFEATYAPQTGFLRSLYLLATFPFEEKPLVIDMHDDLGLEDFRTLQENFDKLRASPSPPVFAVAFVRDREYELRPYEKPSALVFGRICRLSQICYLLLEKEMNGAYANPSRLSSPLWKQIFVGSIADFDIVIKMSSKYFRHGRLLSKSFIGQEYANVTIGGISTLVDFNPVQSMIQQLSSDLYANTLIVFHNPLQADLIGLVWHPKMISSITPQDKLQVPLLDSPSATGSVSLKGKVFLSPKMMGIIQQIQSLGRGLIEQIQIQNKTLVSSN